MKSVREIDREASEKPEVVRVKEILTTGYVKVESIMTGIEYVCKPFGTVHAGDICIMVRDKVVSA